MSKNVKELQLANKRVVFSYDTPVIVFTTDKVFVVSHFYSSTTSKHINQYLRQLAADSDERPVFRVAPPDLQRILES